jgi:hypothetical protein
MTPEENLKIQEERFHKEVDRILSMNPPVYPWTTDDVNTILGNWNFVVKAYHEALAACPPAGQSFEVKEDHQRQLAELPTHCRFFLEMIMGSWERKQAALPPESRDSESVPPKSSPNRRLIAELLQRGLVTPEQVEQALQVQKTAPGEIGRLLQDLGFVSERDVASVRASILGLQYLDLSEIQIDPSVLTLIPEETIRKYNILPIRQDTTANPNRLMVVIGDVQSSMAGLDDFRLISRCHITPVLAAQCDIQDAIERYFGKT